VDPTGSLGSDRVEADDNSGVVRSGSDSETDIQYDNRDPFGPSERSSVWLINDVVN